MSRRKQSNPKSIKHEGEEADADRRADHAPPNDNNIEILCSDETAIDTKHNNADKAIEINKCLLNSHLSSIDTTGNIDNTAVEKSDEEREEANKDNSIHREQLTISFNGKLLSMKSERLNDTSMSKQSCDDNACDDTTMDQCDISINNTDMIVKRERSESPTNEVRGDSDGGAANQPNSVTLGCKPLGKIRRRKRSRSRSSSKSIGVPSSPDATPNTQSREEAERALVNQLQLPSDVLYLRQQEMTIQGISSVGWVVCCAIPLPQGSSLGPFQGQLVSPEAVKVGDLIVQFTNKKGQQALMNVAGESGGWLALLRSAPTKAERNTHVYWEGGRIWCEVISDIDIGTELRANFSFQNDDDNEEDGDDEAANTNESKHTDASSSEDVNGGTQQLQHSYQQQVTPGHAALIYGCPFCGVRFSSPRTLQGHLSFYCSKKTSEHLVTPAGKDRDKGSNQAKSQFEGLAIKQEPSSQLDTDSPATQAYSDCQADPTDGQSLANQDKKGRAGQVFNCKHCSYKADKLSSLNRHMRMHNNDKMRISSFSSEERVSSVSGDNIINNLRSPNSETFCKECKIQFSNIHTFKCHKEHYCAQRRKKALADQSTFAAMFHSPFSFHDPSKVGVPSALQMAALNQGGLILPRTSSEAALSQEGLILPRTSSEAASQGATSVLLSTPILTAGGVANIAISVPTMLIPPMVGGQDVSTALTSPRTKASSEKHQSGNLLTSQTSSQPLPLNRFLNLSTTTQVDYTQTLEELHNSKDFSIQKAESPEEDHPLDLTTTKKEIKSEKDNRKEESQTYSTFLQPDRDGALDARRVICSPSLPPGTSVSYHQSRDLIDNPSPPAHSSAPQNLFKKDSTEVKRETHSSGSQAQHILRSEHMTPNSIIVQVLPHPSILVSPAGFLSMPLTISPPAKRSAPLSPSSSLNGISKCADCNIVFYKHDNYIIHKKHYCSGKRRPGSQSITTGDTTFFATESEIKIEPELTQSKSPPLSQSPTFKSKKDLHSHNEYVNSIESNNDVKASPSKHSSEVKYKFYCVPCRIKFSNSSILEAHKEYYCPAGKDSEQSVIVQTSSSETVPPPSPKDDWDHNNSPESSPDEFTCTRCNSIFVSARLLRLHVCDGGFPCPHCDHVSITENRLVEHLKVHAPTKAYRCTICGYRGNTARGMRMHGKTHIDEGLDFTDENMLAYHEPALIPVDHSSYPGTTSDTELLRLKNEPYKRRRSRKAYEKFDYPLPKVDIPQTCPLCGQNFANAEFLASHFKVHEIAASQYMSGLLKCIQCSFIGKSLENLHSHYESHHRTKSTNKRQRLSSPDRDEPSSIGRSSSPALWRSSRKSSNDDPEVNASVTGNNSSSNDNSEIDSHKFESDTKKDESTSTNLVNIKIEPFEESKHDRESSNKLNHFLQPPNPSPLSSLPSNVAMKEESPSPSFTRGHSDSLTDQEPDDQEPSCSGGVECTRQNKVACQMESEPGEINTAHIKHEPRYDDEDADLKVQFYSSHEQDSKQEDYDSSNDHKVNVYTSDSSDKPYKNHEHFQSDSALRSPLPTSYIARQGNISPKSIITTPNFLVSSPSSIIPSHSPTEPTTNSRIFSSLSSFQTTKPTTITTASLSSIFPLHSTQSHSITFPCTTTQLSLPYLFLPSIQPTSSVSIQRSPNAPDERMSGARYCQNCDISFSKHATYLAHKKYYCTAQARGEVQSSAKA